MAVISCGAQGGLTLPDRDLTELFVKIRTQFEILFPNKLKCHYFTLKRQLEMLVRARTNLSDNEQY